MNEVKIRKQNIRIRVSPCQNCKAAASCSNTCDKFRMWFCGEWHRLRRMYGVAKREEGEK